MLYPHFLESNGKFNRRISEYLINLDEYELEDLKSNHELNFDSLYNSAFNSANEIAENIFWELEIELKDKIQEDQDKIHKYYKQKSQAIEQVKIENIKIGKQKELKREKSEKLVELKKQSRLFPELECFQVTNIKFV